MAGHALSSRQSINIPDVLRDERFVPGDDPAPFRSLLVAPLIVKERALGTISLSSEQVNAFSATDETLIGLMADQMAAALENAQDITARRLAEEALQQEVVERRQIEEKLRQYTVDLEAQNAELEAFAHTVAHDLKNPVTTMVGYAEVLQRNYEELGLEVRQTFLTAITQGGYKIGDIVDALLLLASVREKKEIDIHPLEMGRIVADARGRLLSTIEEYRGEIILPNRWPVALGYGPWIEAVWTNYLSNALKYGGTPPRIELGGEVEDAGWVRFWIRDNGPGLSAEEQARLFTPFERLHQMQASGYGLGLSIVQRILHKLGGRVGVESQGAGRGSTFYFVLPALPSDKT